MTQLSICFTAIIAVIVLVLDSCNARAAPASTSQSNAASFSLTFGSCNHHKNDQSYWKAIQEYQRRRLNKDSSRTSADNTKINTNTNNNNNHQENILFDALVWLGDIVYTDYAPWYPWLPHHYLRPQAEVREIWNEMKNNNTYYSDFVASTKKIVGIWDDHEFCSNDEGERCPTRKINQQHLLDFLDVPAASASKEAKVRRLERDGVYALHKFPFRGFETDRKALPVCVILLDFRSQREPPRADEEGSKVLGERQWKWFRHALTTGRDLEIDDDGNENDHQSHGDKQNGVSSIDDVCAVTLIGSGVQVIFDAAPMETWGEYRAERDRLLREIAKSTARRILLLSGDVHYTEAGFLSHTPVTIKNGTLASDANHDFKQRRPLAPTTTLSDNSPLYERCPESIWPDQDLFEVTSSGLTHHEDRDICDEVCYNKWFPSHRRFAPGIWMRKNVGFVDVSCSDVHDAESCRVVATLVEVPRMNEILTTEPVFVPKAQRIPFGDAANKFFRERYPRCPQLHDIGNTYKLRPYPGPWTRAIDLTKLYVPFMSEWFRLELMFVHFYSAVAVCFILVLVLLKVLWNCLLKGRRQQLRRPSEAPKNKEE